MPIHFDDVDVAPEIGGLGSALIVPCNMCPAVTVAVREEKPFIELFKSFLKSVPFEHYVKALQSRLKENGVKTSIFKSSIPHQWFLCMWTKGKRKQLQNYAKQHEAVIVLGCESATVTVRDAVRSTGCKVIEGMKTAGIMNARLRLHWPGNASFEDCKIVPLSQ